MWSVGMWNCWCFLCSLESIVALSLRLHVRQLLSWFFMDYWPEPQSSSSQLETKETFASLLFMKCLKETECVDVYDCVYTSKHACLLE